MTLEATGMYLSPSHIRIIKSLIFNSKLIPSRVIVGLTSTGLESTGISRTTVNDNLKVLLSNHLIKVVHVDNTKGVNSWVYYDASPQGVIAILKNIGIKEIAKEFNQKILARFFPLITLHWDELLEIIGGSIPFFLKLTIDQIGIHNYYAQEQSIDDSPLQLLTESINLDITTGFAIKLKTPSLPFYEEDFTDKKLMIEGKYIEIEQRITKLVTFLFYLNLIKYPFDKNLHVTEYFLDSLGTLSLDNVRNKNFEPLINMNKYSKEDILSVINHDTELYSIVKSITDEIYQKMHIPRYLEFIHDELVDS